MSLSQKEHNWHFSINQMWHSRRFAIARIQFSKYSQILESRKIILKCKSARDYRKIFAWRWKIFISSSSWVLGMKQVLPSLSSQKTLECVLLSSTRLQRVETVSLSLSRDLMFCTQTFVSSRSSQSIINQSDARNSIWIINESNDESKRETIN